MKFPGESGIKQKTKVLDFGRFKYFCVIEVEGDTVIGRLARRAEDDKLSFVSIEREPISPKPFNKLFEFLIYSFLDDLRVLVSKKEIGVVCKMMN
jgi:hypothetical protein